MTRFLATFLVWCSLQSVANAEPVVRTEDSGLRLEAFCHYKLSDPFGVILTKRPSASDGEYKIELFVLLQNCGKTNITLPTQITEGKIGGSRGAGVRIFSYGFRPSDFHGKQVVRSPFSFQPVTLAPGESTLLPVQAIAVQEQFVESEGALRYFVSFSVEKQLADRHGWWSGDLLVPVSEEKKEPNQPPVPTAPSGRGSPLTLI